MNLDSQGRLTLRARNEGKIKSYESCTDIRAWSHDHTARNRYLREWMKSNMPVNIIPVHALTKVFENMTCRSRAKTAPRCNRDCKSKVLLDSISKSCHAMRECLKENHSFEKYFEEEEFETCHWPCERCLDALKSIKMFWKIIVEKLFHADVPTEAIDDYAKSIHSLAKNWQNEMLNQTEYVKKAAKPKRDFTKRDVSPKLNTIEKSLITNDFKSNELGKQKHKASYIITKSDRNSSLSARSSECKNKNDTPKPCIVIPCKKCHKYTNINISTTDAKCSCKVLNAHIALDSCNFENEQNELKICKNNLEYLQNELIFQLRQINKLKSENLSLKSELEKVYKKQQTFDPTYYPISSEGKSLLPKPFDNSAGEDVIKDIDSEMVITMKNCKNDDFRHVSLLQVLHKTNGPIGNEHNCLDNLCTKREDPLYILNKVHHTFGAIVRKEVAVIKDEQRRTKKLSDINASFQKMEVKPASSCTVVSSLSISSLSNFESVKISDI